MWFQWLALALGFTSACSPSNISNCTIQWASKVLDFSNEDGPSYGAINAINQPIGEPPDAWRPETSSRFYAKNYPVEYLHFGFDQPLWIVAVGVDEQAPGGTVQISAQTLGTMVNTSDTNELGFVTLWEGEDESNYNNRRYFAPPITCTIRAQNVLLKIRTDVQWWYPEIAGVAIHGSLTPPPSLPICNYTSLCTPNYCQRGGKCITNTNGTSCLCSNAYYGDHCELLRVYPVMVGNVSSISVSRYSPTDMLGPEDSDAWDFDIQSFYAPPYVFGELYLENPIYVHGFSVMGWSAGEVINMYVLAPEGHWIQVWEGIATDVDDYVYDVDTMCSTPFLTKGIRFHLNSVPEGSINAIRVQGSDRVPAPGANCTNFCNNSPCYQSRCLSGTTSSSCACFSSVNLSWAGPICDIAQQYSDSGDVVGGFFLDWGHRAELRSPVGLNIVSAGFAQPMFIVGYTIDEWSSSYTEVYASVAGTNEWMNIWSLESGIPIGNDIFCQPNFTINAIAVAFNLPLECADCNWIDVESIRMSGTFGNRTLPACKNPCASHQCMNNATCLGHRNNTFSCLCAPNWGGRLCDVEANYAIALLAHSRVGRPTHPPSVLGAPDCNDSCEDTDFWAFADDNWSPDPTREPDFLELEFETVNATGLRLYESDQYGYLSNVLIFVSLPFPHYQEVLHVTTPNGEDVENRVYMPSWACRGEELISRVRLEFIGDWDPSRDYRNHVDAIQLFSVSDNPLPIPPLCINQCTNASYCGVGGLCVSRGTNATCICLANYTGAFCELREVWVQEATSSSDFDATYDVSFVVGPPQVYPAFEDSAATWTPRYGRSWLKVKFETLFIEGLDLYHSGSVGGISSILVQVDTGSAREVFLEVWSGDREFDYNIQRTLFNVADFTCNPGKVDVVRFEFHGVDFAVDSIRMSGKDTPLSISSPPSCAPVCSPNPCQNNGVCIARASSTHEEECECLNGFYGTHCELEGIWWASQVRGVSSTYYTSSFYARPFEKKNLLGAPSPFSGTGDPIGSFRFEARDSETVHELGTIEFMEVSFPSPVFLNDNGVRVLEVANPGAIVRILVRTQRGQNASSSPLVEIWTKPDNFTNADPFQPLLSCRPSFAVDTVRIEVDVNLITDFEEYDAIALVGSSIQFDSTAMSVPECVDPLPSVACTCLNDGVCVLAQGDRKSCLCNDFWRGESCQFPGLLQTRALNQRTVFVTHEDQTSSALCMIHVQGDVVCYNYNAKKTLFSLQAPQNNVTWMQVVATEELICVLDSGGEVSCFERWGGRFVTKLNETFYSLAANAYQVCGITRRWFLKCHFCVAPDDAQWCPNHELREYRSVSISAELTVAVTRTGIAEFFLSRISFIPKLYSWIGEPTHKPVEFAVAGGMTNASYCLSFVGGGIYCQGQQNSKFFDRDDVAVLVPSIKTAAINDHTELCLLSNAGLIRCRNGLAFDYELTASSALNSIFSDSIKFVGVAGTLSGPYASDDHPVIEPRAFCGVQQSGSLVCGGDFNLSMITRPVKLACDYWNGGCSPYSSCTNVAGGAKCTCLDGFSTVSLGLFFIECQDIDECAGPSPCLPGETCTNTIGSYQCRSREAVLLAAVGCGGGVEENGVLFPIGCSTSGTDQITLCGAELVDTQHQAVVYSLAENGGRCEITQPYHSNQWLNVTVNGKFYSYFCPQKFSIRVPVGSGTHLKLELSGATTTPTLWYSYAAPFVSGKSGCTSGCSREGYPRPMLTLHGVNFGVRPSVFIGGQSCVTNETTHDRISCRWPVGKGINTPVVVLSGGQIANPVSVSYASCPPGTENDQNSTDCVPCLDGFVRSDPSIESCTLCGPGKYANAPRTDCDDCKSKNGLSCSGGVAASLADFWGYRTQQDIVVIRCPPNHCLSNNQCAPGREPASVNFLCGACTPPLAVWSDQCMRCDKPNGSLLLGLIILFECFFLFSYLTSRRDRNAGMPKLLVYFVQISLVLAGVADVHLTFLQIFMFDLASASLWSSSCLFPMSVEAQLVMALLMPLWLLLIVFVNYGCHKVLNQLVPLWKRLSPPSFDHYFRTCLTVLVFAYSATCTRVFQFLRCVSIDGVASVLQSHPTISCDGFFYLGFRPFVIFMLTVYILGFPIGCVGWLAWWKRKGVLGTYDASHKSLNYRWGIWFMVYRPPAFYWQSVELLRRFMFAILDHLADTSRGLAFSYLNLAALLAQMVVVPYLDPVMNKAELFMHIVLLCLSLLVTSTDGGSVPASWIFFLLVLLTLVAGVSHVLFKNAKALKAFLKTRKEAARSRKEQEMESAVEVSKLPRSASAMPADF